MKQWTFPNGSSIEHADATHRWAVVEIRRDGSLGKSDLISTAGAKEAAALSKVPSGSIEVSMISPALEADLAQLQAAQGHLHAAKKTLTRGMRRLNGLPGAAVFAGPLALLEAFQCDLRRAEAHADLSLRDTAHAQTDSVQHALLATAWIHLEHAEHTECGRVLEQIEMAVPEHLPSWFATARSLLTARLLVATHQPDAACRLLATASEGSIGTCTGWANGILAAAHAEALVAAGESRRALAELSPPPAEAEVEAAVVTAAGRQAIGDGRGAGAVLREIVEALEHAPLGLQIRAWLLEAHIADQHGRRDRSQLLVDRALNAATPDRLCAPLLWEWCWLRTFIEQNPALLHAHRDFLVDLHDPHPTGGRPTLLPVAAPDPYKDVLPSTLTEREAQVLELLAQMYSTDEIARALFVSTNTVKTHVKGIFAKMCVNRRVDAVRRGRQWGLL